MVKNPSSKEKRRTERSRGLTAQNKKELECILGCCDHNAISKKCVYWQKVVDSDYPERVQYKLILKLIKKIGGK